MPLGALAAEGEQAEATTTTEQQEQPAEQQPAEQQPAEQPSVEKDEQPADDQSGTVDEDAADDTADTDAADADVADDTIGTDKTDVDTSDDQSAEQKQPAKQKQLEDPSAVVLSDGEAVSDDAANAEVRADQDVYYVDATKESDGDGTGNSPFLTLQEAVKQIGEGETGTIYLLSDITLTDMVSVVGINLTIESVPGETYTISRGETFVTNHYDQARGTYNTAMIEVTTWGDNDTSLTLRNVTVDDHFRSEGKWFSQATTDGMNEAGQDEPRQLTVYNSNNGVAGQNLQQYGPTVHNKDLVQDAIIAAYGTSTTKATITLGEGATLQNFGGMSAVRLIEGGKLHMEKGSKICDTDTTHKRSKGTDKNLNSQDKPSEGLVHQDGGNKYYAGEGAVAAVWVQGTDADNLTEAEDKFVMDAGATISDVDGRAVYMDKGKASIQGTIENITGNKMMTQAQNGVAIHLRGGASVTLNDGAEVDGVNATGGSAIWVCTSDTTFTMNDGVVISNGSGTAIYAYGTGRDSDGVYHEDNINIFVDGEITNLNNGNAINLNDSGGIYCKIGKNANIHDNLTNCGALYVQGDQIQVDLYGKINNNSSVGTFGPSAVWLAHNHKDSTITMYDGAEIKGNISNTNNNGAVMISMGDFIMEGGTIADNKVLAGSDNGSAPVVVWNSGRFTMNGGTIANNYSAKLEGGAVEYVAVVWNNGKGADPVIQLNNGTISGNYMGATINNDGTYEVTDAGIPNDLAIAKTQSSNISRYFSISDQMAVATPTIYLVKYGAYLTNPAENVKFGNASSESITTLVGASKAAGFSEKEFVSLWCYSGKGSTELEFSNVPGIDETLPVYAALVPVDANGDPLTDAVVEFYGVTQQNGKLEVAFPSDNANGYAVALVQPKEDYGIMAITMPESLDEKQADASGNYTLAGSASYTISETLLNMMKQDSIDAPTFTIELDKNAIISADAVTLSSDIFAIEKTIYDGNTNTLTVQCKLKEGWETAANKTSTLQWTTVLPKTSFKADTSLNVTGQFDGTVPSDKPVIVNVLATPDSTLMVSGILIRTADITVYMGGHTDAVVDENGHITVGTEVANAGFPEPGFLVDFPGNVTSGAITLREQGGNKTWTLKPYDGSNTTVYRIDPGENQEPLRVQFTDANGNTVVSDAFDVGTAVNQELTMDLYKGSVGEVKAYTSDGTSYYVTVVPGTLTVRGTTGNVHYGSKIAENAQAPAGESAVKVADGTTFTINGSDVLAKADAVQLLFDDVINTTLTQQDRLIQLAQRADTVLGAPATGKVRNFTAKYLDLVDTSNGNTWVKASQDVTVCWPYPEGTDQNTEFTVLHFKDLHRDMAAGEVSGEIATSEVETMTGIVKTATHIEFKTDEFSPFALVWYTDKPADNSKNDNEESSSSSTTIQTTQTTTASASAAAPAAAPTAVIPQTSDDSQPALWAGLLVFSGAALTALYLLKRRKQNRER